MLQRVRGPQKRFDFLRVLFISLPRKIESSEEMKDFDRVCIYVDNNFQAEDSFTVRNNEQFTRLSARWSRSLC